jgi:hypothetical protein
VRIHFGQLASLSDKLSTALLHDQLDCNRFFEGAATVTSCPWAGLAVELAAGERFGTGPDTAGVDFGLLGFGAGPGPCLRRPGAAGDRCRRLRLGPRVGLYLFRPHAAGLVNWDFGEVRADVATYCHDSFLSGRTAGGMPQTQPRVLLLLTLATDPAAKVELAAGARPSRLRPGRSLLERPH